MIWQLFEKEEANIGFIGSRKKTRHIPLKVNATVPRWKKVSVMVEGFFVAQVGRNVGKRFLWKN